MELSSRTKKLNMLGLCIVFFLQVIDNGVRDAHLFGIARYTNLLKNGSLLLVCLLFLREMFLLKKKQTEFVFVDEFKNIIKLIIGFLILSLFYMIKNNGCSVVTFTGLIRLFIPVVVAFATLNVMSLDEIYKTMIAFLIGSFFMYLFTIGLSNLYLDNFLSISFLDSFSPFESNFFSPMAIAFCLFFCYFRKNLFWAILSVIFTIMTFKRIMVLYALFVLFFGWIFVNKKQVPECIIWIIKISICVLSAVYILLNMGKFDDIVYDLFGISLNKFTMGRTWLFNSISRKFKSIGFMSTSLLGRGMEMDFPQIYLEMSFLSVILSINYITNIAKRNWYTILIVIFILLELLTSHWFDVVYFWLIAYITIGCVLYKDSTGYTNKRRFRLKI